MDVSGGVEILFEQDTWIVEGILDVATATTNCLAPSVSEPVITRQSCSLFPPLTLSVEKLWMFHYKLGGKAMENELLVRIDDGSEPFRKAAALKGYNHIFVRRISDFNILD